MRHHSAAADDATANGGLMGKLKAKAHQLAIGGLFVRLFFHRAEANPLPQSVRLAPAW
jgi:magnesium-protoporphyrin IX monomethyl ester (oxidative) cyclase